MAKKDKDIFDKIMDWKIFGWFRPFYVKNKEMLLYLFFGVLTTAVSFVTAGISKVLLEQAGIGKGGVSTTSTVISWICAVTFAYITNRIWVFESEAEGKKAIISEAASFYGGRIFTLLVEMFMMWYPVALHLRRSAAGHGVRQRQHAEIPDFDLLQNQRTGRLLGRSLLFQDRRLLQEPLYR